MAHSIRINGASHSVDVEDDMPLLWVLRDVLDLKGPKFGCGIGQCGACTVHADGTAIRSCTLPIAAVGSREITTLFAVILLASGVLLFAMDRLSRKYAL